MNIPSSLFISIVWANLVCVNFCLAYAPELNRDALAGIWRLTGLKSIYQEFSDKYNNNYLKEHENKLVDLRVFTIKEFTTYPKKIKRPTPKEIIEDSSNMDSSPSALTSIVSTWHGHRDILLKLCDDGSFVQYSSMEDPLEVEDGEEKEDSFNKDKAEEATLDDMKSILDLVRNKASVTEFSKGIDYSKYTDYRPPTLIREEQGTSKTSSTYVVKGLWDFKDGELILAASRPPNSDPKTVHDTVLVGKVVAEEAVVQANHNSSSPTSLEYYRNQKIHIDRDNISTAESQYLSVPDGEVNIGKFFYPMHHPSFFERPIYSPTKTGSFQLKQILGEANLQFQNSDQRSKDYTEESGKEFKKEQLVGKVFYLTSQPIGWAKKNKPRWSRSRKSFVVDPIPTNENEKIFGLRVMEVVLFANNTFSTISGLGSSTVLRGKWDIVGTDRNYLWMQVWRFGFGRSVSGSTYSEGPGLSKSDEKAYWGKIEECNVENIKEDGMKQEENENTKRIEIKGTIFWGWGLEPVPEGQFSMTERLFFDEESVEQDDEDDDELFDTSIGDNHFE